MVQVLRVGLLVLLLCIGSGGIQAQGRGQSCPEIVRMALEQTDMACGLIGRDEVCYGHTSLQATPREDVEAFVFAATGDAVALPALRGLRLSAMDEASGVWGVALMRLQADLPATLPGQLVTMLVFGDVDLTYAGEVDDRPGVQAFYFTSGLLDSPCQEAPNSGILVKTPEVAEAVAVNLQFNGVDVMLGSTAFLQAQPGHAMIIHLLEGEALVSAGGMSRRVRAGEQIEIPLDSASAAAGRPVPPVPLDELAVRGLPLWLLEGPYFLWQCHEGESYTAPLVPHYIAVASDGPHFASSLNAFSYGVTVDGERRPAISGTYLYGRGANFAVQQRFDVGPLEPGTHTVTFLGAVSREISDPNGDTWGPASWSNSCTWTIEAEE